DHMLADPDRAVRLAVLRLMHREKVPARAETLIRWLREERGEEAVAVLLDSLRGAPAAETASALKAVVGEKIYGTTNRLRALALLAAGQEVENAKAILDLFRSVEDGPV